jgi:hypothetical protein
VSVANEDVVAWNGSSFSVYFDGSDVGLSAHVTDAFAVISKTEVLLSFAGSATINGAGTVDDSDIVKFTATSLGSTTSGTFSLYFDGSDVGLTQSGEDIDTVELLDNGHLLISTTDSVSVPGASGQDEDIFRFVPASLGVATSGTWSMYFDGSDVGLSSSSSEDVDALAVGPAQLYLSTTGNFSVTGASGADEDVFLFNPTTLGLTTSGTYKSGLFFDGSLFGLSSNDISGVDLP